MFHVRGVFRNFLRKGASIFVTFFQAEELFLSILSAQNDSRGSGGMLPWKISENLHTAMAILVLFEQFLRKVCHIFGP